VGFSIVQQPALTYNEKKILLPTKLQTAQVAVETLSWK